MRENLPKIREADVTGLNVIVRADLEWEGVNCPRQIATEKIVEFLKLRGAVRVKVIGHKGNWPSGIIEVVNDLRNDPREEANDIGFANELAEGFDVYVNEAFATSHRKHTSIVALPEAMKVLGKKVYMGLRFEKEIEMLSQVFGKTGRRILVIGGAKAGDKAEMADKLAPKFDAVLRGGLLDRGVLRPDGLDINDETIEKYKQEIMKAAEIVVAGPMGIFEKPDSEKGTKDIFEAIANNNAYRVAGGGNTEEAIEKYNLREKFDWISVGGGAMLQYLADGTLPGIEALV